MQDRPRHQPGVSSSGSRARGVIGWDVVETRFFRDFCRPEKSFVSLKVKNVPDFPRDFLLAEKSVEKMTVPQAAAPSAG